MLNDDDKKIKRLVDLASADLKRSARLLEYRRINWHHVAVPRITKLFEQLHRDSQQSELPFKFHGDHVDTPNEEVLQVRAGQSFTGTFNRKYRSIFEDGPKHSDMAVLETGGELVASQSVTGHVFFLVTPRQSDRSKPDKTDLIIMGPLDPCDVTERRVRKVIKRYVLLLKATSNVGSGSLSFMEWIIYQWMYTFELGSRNQLVRDMLSLRNEWVKAIFAAVASALIVVWLARFGIKPS